MIPQIMWLVVQMLFLSHRIYDFCLVSDKSGIEDPMYRTRNK